MVRRIRDSNTFCRLLVTGDDDLIVDLALDSPPKLPPAHSIAGPTFGLQELVGRKLVALFDRAEARDFADVYTLAQRYNTALLLDQAGAVDSGFNKAVLAAMLTSIARFDDNEIPVPQHAVDDLRRFFHNWRQQLLAEAEGDNPS